MYHLIIVEDEKIVREALQDYIRLYCPDYTVCGTFSNGEDALGYIRAAKVDVVLTDIKMSRMDGLALCKELHANFPHCYTIIISGFNTFDYARQALQYGVKNYLVKPINFKELSESLDTIKKSLDTETLHINTSEDNEALFFTDLVSGNIQSPEQLQEAITRTGLSFLSENSCGCVLRLSFSAEDHTSFWRYEADRLPYALTNVLRMKLPDTYVNCFLSVGRSYYYIVIFKGQAQGVPTLDLEQNMLELFNIPCHIISVCQFQNLAQLTAQKILQKLSVTLPPDMVQDENTVIEKIKNYIILNYSRLCRETD